MSWHYSISDYVRLEDSTPHKYEYFDGTVRFMGGVPLEHARMTATIACMLGKALEGRSSAVFASLARVRILPSNLITYPDVIVCSEPVKHDVEDPCAVINPTIVIEVTSRQSEAYDRGGKLDCYRFVPSIRDIVIVSHRDHHIEVHHREGDGTWTIEHGTMGESVRVRSIDCALDVDAVYHDPLAAS